MAKLDKIGFKNFRSFTEWIEIDFAPITVLTGQNSSGKSSVLKALLLLKDGNKQTKNKIPEHLSFTGGKHNLGNITNTINTNSEQNFVALRLPFSLKNTKDKFYIDLYYEENKNNLLKDGVLIKFEVFFNKNKKKLISGDIETGFWEFSFDLKYLKNYFNTSVIEFRIKDLGEKWKHENFSEFDKKEFQRLTNTENISFDSEKVMSLLYGLGEPENKDKLRKRINIENIPMNNYFIEGDINKIKEILIEKNYIFTEKGDANINEESDYFTYKDLINVKEAYFYLQKKLLQEYKAKNKDDLQKLFADAEIISLEKFTTKKEYESWGLYYEKDGSKHFEHMIHHEEGAVLEHYEYSIDLFNDLYTYINSLSDDKEFRGGGSIINRYFDILKENYEEKTIELIENICIEERFRPFLFMRFGIRNDLNNTFKTLKRFSHLEAVRANAQRLYSFQSQGTGFNQLLLEFEKKGFQKDSREMKFINKWSKEFGIKEPLNIKINEQGVGSSIYFGDRLLSDLGYGITQFLPILLKITVVSHNNSILYIEEPETNLHPKLQSKLADLFVDAARTFYIQFILETHSEYLIRKLQYLTAKKEIKPEGTAIYYFNHPDEVKDGEEQVKKLRIQEDGMLDGDFGHGFFDEATSLRFDILRLKNQQKN